MKTLEGIPPLLDPSSSSLGAVNARLDQRLLSIPPLSIRKSRKLENVGYWNKSEIGDFLGLTPLNTTIKKQFNKNLKDTTIEKKKKNRGHPAMV